MAGTDIPYTALPSGPFGALVLDAVSPLEMYIGTSVSEGIVC